MPDLKYSPSPDQSLTSKKTVAAGVSDSEDVLHSELESPVSVRDQGDLSDRGRPKDDELN